MKGFLLWLTAARYRVVLVATLTMLLAAVHPMFAALSLVGQAVVVLTVLLRGWQEGLTVTVLATLLLVLPPILAGVASGPMAFVAIGNWLPVLLLATLLLRTQSLSLTVQLATVFVATAVALFFVTGSPSEVWRVEINRVIEALDGQLGEVPPAFVEEASRIATGFLAGIALLTNMAAIFIGRWWHSSLTDPGAFGKEFRELRLGVVVGVLAGAVFVLAGLTKMTLLENLSLVMASAFLLHGLAVVHAFAGVVMGSFWLVSVYFLLVVAAPFAVTAIAGLGFIDNWFDLRSRVVRR